jgi:hypothetical protein
LSGSVGTESETAAQRFTWSVTGTSSPDAVGNVSVTVLRNNQVIFSSGAAAGSFNFDSRGPGTYVIWVTADDGDNDWTGDLLSTTAVRSAVVARAPRMMLGGSTGTQSEAQTQAFTWNVTPARAGVSVVVTRDDEVVLTSARATGRFNFDRLGLGRYTLTVTVADANGGPVHTVSRSVTVVPRPLRDPMAAPGFWPSLRSLISHRVSLSRPATEVDSWAFLGAIHVG